MNTDLDDKVICNLLSKPIKFGILIFGVLLFSNSVFGVNVGYLESDLGIRLSVSKEVRREFDKSLKATLYYDWEDDLFFCGYEGIVRVKIETNDLPDLCRKRLESLSDIESQSVKLYLIKKDQRKSLFDELKSNEGIPRLENCDFLLEVGDQVFQYDEGSESLGSRPKLRTKKSIRKISRILKKHNM